MRPYDFYGDLLETHGEVGYLLVVLLALLGYDCALAVALVLFPVQDVYLVPGIDACGEAAVAWGARPPAAPVPGEAGPARALAVADDVDLDAVAAHAAAAHADASRDGLAAGAIPTTRAPTTAPRTAVPLATPTR